MRWQKLMTFWHKSTSNLHGEVSEVPILSLLTSNLGSRLKKHTYLGRVLKHVINFKDVLTYFPRWRLATKRKEQQRVRACWMPAIPITATAREEEEEEEAGSSLPQVLLAEDWFSNSPESWDQQPESGGLWESSTTTHSERGLFGVTQASREGLKRDR